MRLLSFNLLAQGEQINLKPGTCYALSCKVLPMEWASSVALMQEAAEQLTLRGGLPRDSQVVRGEPLPSFLTDVMDQSTKELRPWWHCYLDNFCAGQRVRKGTTGSSGTDLHLLAEDSWSKAGIVSSEKKRVAEATGVQELGAWVDGQERCIGISGERFLKNILGTFFVIGHARLEKKLLQIIAGRWIHCLQFRRPGMCILDGIWTMISGKPCGSLLPYRVRRELLNLCLVAPMLHTFKVMDVMTASDASMKAGAVGIARNLTPIGADFLKAAQMAACSPSRASIFVVSLFNGIGGAFRVYDILGIQPLGGVAVDLYQPAQRVTSRRWPYVKQYKNVEDIDYETCKSWALEYTEADEVHLWAGFPCTDLSSAKAGRAGLDGVASSLFFHIPRIEALLKKTFGRKVALKKTIENVLSMDREECERISWELCLFPYALDSVEAVQMRRPRLCWCSEKLEDAMSGLAFHRERNWIKVSASAPYPALEDWLEPGVWWPGGENGTALPTAMKAIVREDPPWKPAGLQRCDAETLARWEGDNYRYPPYQYREEFVLWKGSKWRLANSEDREILLGYGHLHTAPCMSASDIKRSAREYEDVRCSLLGDSFSIYS